MKLKQVGTKLAGFADKNSQTIMGVLAVGGLIGTIVLSFKAAPKVKKIVEDSKDRIEDIEDAELPEEEEKKEKKEVVKDTAKDLIPVLGPVVTCATATAGLMIGSTVISARKISSLSSIAAMSEVAYKELLDSTKKIVGEEKAKKIQGEADAKQMNEGIGPEKPFNNKGDGEYLCYDAMSGRFWYCDECTIREAVNDLNRVLATGKEDYVNLNDFYYGVGLPPTVGGEDRGWGRYTSNDYIELNLYNTIKHKAGEPAIVVDFMARPTLGYKGH